MTEDEFWAALAPLPPAKPPSYRLYHDENGFPLFFSMEDLPGNYIELDLKEYTNSPSNIRVVDGKLTVLQGVSVVHKLKPSDTGTPCLATDVSIIVDESTEHTKWSLQINETS